MWRVDVRLGQEWRSGLGGLGLGARMLWESWIEGNCTCEGISEEAVMFYIDRDRILLNTIQFAPFLYRVFLLNVCFTRVTGQCFHSPTISLA